MRPDECTKTKALPIRGRAKKLPHRGREKSLQKKRRKKLANKLPLRRKQSKSRFRVKKLSDSVQENILALLCFDTEAIPQILKFARPNHFESKVYRTIADRAIKYFKKYGKAPGDHLPDLLEDQLASKRSEATMYSEALHDLHDLSKSINRDFVLDQVATFIAKQELRIAIVTTAESLQRDEVGKAIAIIRKGLERAEMLQGPEIGPLTVHCAADIKPKSLSPLWLNVLYRRKITLFAGEPGLGKSLAACDIAARVSTASDWPGGEPAVIGAATVIYISGEDDADDTIVPRLIASGADLSKIEIIEDVVEKDDGELSVLSLDKHMPEIHKLMLQNKAVLLVLDPVSAFMGDRDSHRDTSVRALLSKVRQYAKEGNYAVLLITHFNKPGEKVMSAINRVMGSLGFVAAPRSVYAFLRDPDDPEQRLFLPIKSNLGPDTEGFCCRIKVDRTQKLSSPPPYLKWDAKTVEGQRVDEVMAQASPREQARKLKEQEISKWLDGYMKRGEEVPSKEFNEAVQEQGFSVKKVREIMVKFGYIREQEPFQGPWWVVRQKRKGTHGQDTRP